MDRSSSIGMFDSGVGGLTVMRQIIEQLPNENILYFGDTARLPYGEKSAETILRYSLEIADFLLQKEIKLLVVACNTATAHALEVLQANLPIPVIGVIEPGAAKVAAATRNKRIAILATKGTVKSGVYEREIKKRLPDALVYSIPCPLFVPLVEEQFQHHLATKMIIKEYLQPLKKEGVDTVLLGCTHYPLLLQAIQEELGPAIQIVDSAHCCGEAVAKILDVAQLTNRHFPPDYRYYVSDDPESFRLKSAKFLGRPISQVNFIHHEALTLS